MISLVGCGGGDPAPVNASWDLQGAYLQLSPKQNSDAVSYKFTITGVVDGKQISGTGSLALDPHTTGTFESSSASQQVSTLEADYTVKGSESMNVLKSTITNWFTLTSGAFGEEHKDCEKGCVGNLVPKEYILLGTSNATLKLPSKSISGNSGSLYTGTRYSDSIKATVLGKVDASYQVTADNGGNAYFDITIIEKDTSGNQTSKRVMHYFVDPSNAISLKGLSITDSSKDINFVLIPPAAPSNPAPPN